MSTMLDLCCGLGGASAAMRARGWKVIAVDNQTDVNPEVCADVRALPLRPFKVDLLWASPPCEEFTRLALPWKRKLRPVHYPDMSIAKAVRQVIIEWEPRFWCVENTVHARKYFRPLFGRVNGWVAGHVFWSNVPVLLPFVEARKTKMAPMPGGTRARHLERSRIPWSISLAFAKAVEANL